VTHVPRALNGINTAAQKQRCYFYTPTGDDKLYDIFVNFNWVVTWWRYTFTHKQYIEQYKTNNT